MSELHIRFGKPAKPLPPAQQFLQFCQTTRELDVNQAGTANRLPREAVSL
jgi:hypothetical protein